MARMEDGRNLYMIFGVGHPRKKRPLGKPKRRREDNIKIGIQEIQLGGVDQINLARDRSKLRDFLHSQDRAS